VLTHFTCPDYDVAVAFELPSDAKALANMWSHSIQISCPVCRARHAMSYRDAYVTGISAFPPMFGRLAFIEKPPSEVPNEITERALCALEDHVDEFSFSPPSS
jgi:hypothetical protein